MIINPHPIPKELIPDTQGYNNEHLEDTIARLSKGNTYKDLSTIWISPIKNTLHHKVVASWMALQKPMNGLVFGPWFIEGDEVGVAYSKAFEFILTHPDLSKWKFILTVEHDNLPPPDGLLNDESIEKGYDCVGGLYFTKSANMKDVFSQPMIYGNPDVMPKNFLPQVPLKDTLQPCNGLGMGFNLWSMDSLKEKLKDLPKPWFKTAPSHTQDLYFYAEAAKHGFRIACNTSVKVGHIDLNSGMIW